MGRESEESGEREGSELGVRGESERGESGEQLRGKRVGMGLIKIMPRLGNWYM